MKPQHPTKNLDKRRPDYIVCSSTPPPTTDFCLEGKLIKIVKWTPPQAKRTNAWDRGETKYNLASIIRQNFGYTKNDDNDDDYNHAHHGYERTDDYDYTGQQDDEEHEEEQGMDTRAIPASRNVGDVGLPPKAEEEPKAEEDEDDSGPATVLVPPPALPSSLRQYGGGKGNPAPLFGPPTGSDTASTKSASSGGSRFEDIMKQIAEADERNERKIDECNRNMEIQVTQLTDGLATVKDMMERMAATFLEDKNARAAQLTAIDNRFNLQHKTTQEQHQQQQQQTGDVMKLLAKTQSSMDSLANRMPDEPAAKTRKADGDAACSD